MNVGHLHDVQIMALNRALNGSWQSKNTFDDFVLKSFYSAEVRGQ